MRTAKWTVIAVLLAAIAAFLNWSLPSRDIVRILETDVVRRTEQVTTNEGAERSRTQDVRYINAIDTGGHPRVYRNEDTGWGWPPFFKFDSANLAARATDAVSTEEAPRWMILTSYGWRVPMFSMFPNAVSINEADGPDQMLIPWFNIVVLVVLGVAAFLLWRWLGRLVGRVWSRDKAA
ncbi:MAG: DUF1523 family protein [Pseudomonadota bacterium]